MHYSKLINMKKMIFLFFPRKYKYLTKLVFLIIFKLFTYNLTLSGKANNLKNLFILNFFI